MPRPSRFKSASLNYLYDRFIGDDPEQVAAYEKARVNADVAQALYDLRTRAKLTQAQLAKRVGTAASVISRLEDADYDGHSLNMLRRIAAALGRGVDLRFPPLPAGASSRTPAAPKATSRPGAARAAAVASKGGRPKVLARPGATKAAGGQLKAAAAGGPPKAPARPGVTKAAAVASKAGPPSPSKPTQKTGKAKRAEGPPKRGKVKS